MKNVYKIILVVLIFLSFAPVAFGRMPILFKKGEIALSEARYKDALETFKDCLTKPQVQEQDRIVIRKAMANAYIGLKDWKSSETELLWVQSHAKGERVKDEVTGLLKIVRAPDDPNVKIRNLGPAVNSSGDEVAPVISPDGNTLYFVVNNSKGFGKQDIYYSEKNSDGKWQSARNIGEPLNTQGNDGIFSISSDGTTAFLAGVYNIGGQKGNGYSFAYLRGGRWRDPEPVKIEDYYNNTAQTSAYLALNGKALLLSLDRIEGAGGLDIYVCFLKSDGTWTSPLNLGDKINTRGTDGTPFLAADGKTLYFSSTGHIGLGNGDMFKAERLDDTWKNWSEPLNLGKQVNTPNWDAYYTIPAQGNIAYFVSSSEQGFGLGDIYEIELPSTARPGAVVTVSGKVMEPDSTPVGADIFWEKLSTGENVGIAKSNDLTGEYMIVLPVGEAYGYAAIKDGYLPSSANLDLTNATAYGEVHHDIFITPIRKGAQTILYNIFFDFDKATLRKESIGELNRVKKFLLDNSIIKVEIAGHTDSIGTDSYNLILSSDRANTVAQWLANNGIEKERLRAKGYGESKPLDSNETEEGRQRNRRVVFEIIEL